MVLTENLKTAIINERGKAFRVILLNHYFETEEEFYFETIEEAENFAKFWLTTDRL